MSRIKSGSDLKDAIRQLELQQAGEARAVKEHFLVAYESIKPINLIKSIYQEVIESGDLKDKVVNTSVGLTAGFISKLLFQGVTRSPVKKLIGTAIMFGITNVVAKHPKIIKLFGQGAMTIFSRSYSGPEQDMNQDK